VDATAYKRTRDENWPCCVWSDSWISRCGNSHSASACAEIAAALLHSTHSLSRRPTIGLDAPSKLAVREFVKRLNRERGVTVLLTTHDMHDIDALAERYRHRPRRLLRQGHRGDAM
jgi:ABC-2 type transport system ATP-binding protein